VIAPFADELTRQQALFAPPTVAHPHRSASHVAMPAGA
jgi:hypothetical protein